MTRTEVTAQVTHGTLKGYLDGCRCDPCRLGWNAYMGKRRAAERLRLAEAAFDAYRAEQPRARKRDFIAGFLAGRSRGMTRAIDGGGRG